MKRLTRSPHAVALTIVLLVQMAALYGLSRQETPPPHQPLSSFPAVVNGWVLAQEGVVDKEVREVLRADDLLTRIYRDSGGSGVVSLFVAYFKSQRTGAAPHSPRNCLPGAGWIASSAGIVSISLPGRAEPIRVNQYIVAKGDAKSVVLYWYQSRGRVVAGEFAAKLYLIDDSIRYNRTETALVRVTVPVRSGAEEAAGQTAAKFVRDCFASLEPLTSAAAPK